MNERHSIKVAFVQILNANSCEEECTAVNGLIAAYERFLSTLLKAPVLSSGELRTSAGLALDPRHAVDCLRDRLRTSRFIKGINRALERQLKLHGEASELQVLYAGTGPLGTLFIPWWCAHPEANVRVLFLEFVPASAQFLVQLLDELGFDSNRYEVRVCDASTAAFKDRRFDMVITETMHRALLDEPQVSITAHLAPLLKSSGTWIPESVDLFYFQTRFPLEPQYDHNAHQESCVEVDAEAFNREGDHTHFFSLTRNFRMQPGSVFPVSTEVFDLGTFRPNLPDVCIETRIRVFDGIQVPARKSQLTNPYCLFNRQNWPDKRMVSFQYSLERAPRWRYALG